MSFSFRTAAATAVTTLAFSLGGCTSVSLLPPKTTVHRGGAYGQKTARIFALPATCGSLSPFGGGKSGGTVCSPELLDSASQRVRAELELRGMSVVDAERTNAEVRSRIEIVDETRNFPGTDERVAPISPTSTMKERHVVVHGARFEDATPAAQMGVVDDLGVDSVLRSRVWVGALAGLGGRRIVRVQLRLDRVATGEMEWSSRCDVEVGLARADAAVVEEATMCALRSAFAP